MPDIDLRAVVRWFASIGAKLLVALFLAPFVFLGAALAYAFGASRAGPIAGTIAAVGFFVLAVVILEYWLRMLTAHQKNDQE